MVGGRFEILNLEQMHVHMCALHVHACICDVTHGQYCRVTQGNLVIDTKFSYKHDDYHWITLMHLLNWNTYSFNISIL